MLVKVCGITDKEQYRKLVLIGVDMIGLNFYPDSKRFVTRDVVDSNIDNRPVHVGVFVNSSQADVIAMAVKHELDYIQLHGDESPVFCAELSSYYPVIKVFGINNLSSFKETSHFESLAEYFLFDTKSNSYGGSGMKFNWDMLNEYTGVTPFILSGGICPGDIEQIQRIDHPMFAGIDINSRFEISPGIKDLNLIKNFMNELKQ